LSSRLLVNKSYEQSIDGIFDEGPGSLAWYEQSEEGDRA
jgi:hypothetical protein